MSIVKGAEMNMRESHENARRLPRGTYGYV